jgi:signal peptide peptidase SppA
MYLTHLASRLFGTPLLIARPKLDVILSVLGPRLGLPDTQTKLALPPTRATKPTQPGIAVIPVYGTLVKRTLGLEAASGLTSYAQISEDIDAALKDSAVDGILLDIDSPGGEASGVFELAEHIRKASETKPVWAHANDSALSAAYAIAAAANRITLSKTAGVGSIGVIALHVDQSQHDAKEGLTYTAIYAGSHKNDLSPHQPLTESAHDALQSEVDRLYGMFVSQVAEMRSLDPKKVIGTEAGLFFGDNAIESGLADDVGTFEQTLAAFAETLKATKVLHSKARASPASQNNPISLSQTHIQECLMHDTDDTVVADEVTETPETPALKPEAVAQTISTPKPMDTRAEAHAIAELCLLAGQPQRTAEFLASGMTQAQVRTTLIEARAQQPEIQSHITAEASTQSQETNNLLMAATQKLTHKE